MCLANYYIDNYGYQENILPKMHALQGLDVKILASTETYVDNKSLGYVAPCDYVNEHGIPVTRIGYVKYLPHFFAKKWRAYQGVFKQIESFEPDIIFMHDVQFASVYSMARYARKFPEVEIYADGHTDLINSARGWVSKNILHRIIYKHFAQKIEPYVTKFFGVTPLRSDFYRDYYGIPPEKIGLLVMGADDSEFDFEKRFEIRREMRKRLGLAEDDFVLVTGGKIDERKKIHVLLKLLAAMKQPQVKLILFGVPSDEMEEQITRLSKSEAVIDVGWISPTEVYDYLFASDLAVFPGTHSVLWEVAVGVGLPAIYRRWEGGEHVDVGGNCLFINDTVDDLEHALTKVISDTALYKRMKKVATDVGVIEFSYSEIAKRAIGQSTNNA